MTTLMRSPLTVRSPSFHISPAYSPNVQKTSSVKRARSPEPAYDSHAQNIKRVKATDISTSVFGKDEIKRKRDREKAERENDFRIKYTRAFPKFSFYFDFDDGNVSMRDELKARVNQLGASIEYFFSQTVTHLITDQPEQSYTNKENAAKSKSALLQSPIRLKGRALKDSLPESGAELVKKAVSLQIKIWSPAKLESVLDRCQVPLVSAVPTAQSSTAKDRSLSRLLESERLHGTSERDPTQKRHDFVYFSKSSYFVLVEDMRQELATIATLEYPIKRDRDGREKGSWPVLYCHPLAKGPFIPYDEKKEEERRKQKAAEQAHQVRERHKASQREERKREAQLHAKRQTDLRRSVSMNNLHRRATFPLPGTAEAQGDFVDLDDDNGESADASGLRESGQYVAASGNSVGITSTTGTTSTTGNRLRTLQLPPALRGRLQQEVITSRRFPLPNAHKNKENTMGPPPVPDRASKPLRKSKSTNTLRLPKREEGTKPGYCESCRQKFEDFKSHITGRRHRKFAADDNNFVALDYVLARVRRRTVKEIQTERDCWRPKESQVSSNADDDDEESCVKEEYRDDPLTNDFPWNDWVTGEVEVQAVDVS